MQQYGNNFRTLYQQKVSRLRPWCQIESITGQSKTVERMGAANAYDITSRHADTKFVEVPHSRRWIDLADKGKELTLLADSEFQIGQVLDILIATIGLVELTHQKVDKDQSIKYV